MEDMIDAKRVYMRKRLTTTRRIKSESSMSFVLVRSALKDQPFPSIQLVKQARSYYKIINGTLSFLDIQTDRRARST